MNRCPCACIATMKLGLTCAIYKSLHISSHFLSVNDIKRQAMNKFHLLDVYTYIYPMYIHTAPLRSKPFFTAHFRMHM